MGHMALRKDLTLLWGIARLQYLTQEKQPTYLTHPDAAEGVCGIRHYA